MSASAATKETEIEKNSVMEILSLEISSIAREIEDLPESALGEISYEQMVWMQQIDFCSQRLAEVSKLIKQLSSLEASSNEDLTEMMRAKANLEHVRKLFD